MNETLSAETEVRTYRGSSLEALLPQIRGELGAEAVILRQREGLIGGVGGFFQKRCVEVDARAGGARVDVYDDGETGPARVGADGPRVLSQGEGGAAGEDVLGPPPPVPPAAGAAPADGDGLVRNDGATREGLSTPAVQELVRQARPFAEMLEEAGPEPGLEPAAPSEPEPPRPAPKRAATLRDGLVAAGLGADLATEIVDAVVARALPFANPGRLRTLVRDELALRLPVAPAAGPGRRVLAAVGPAGAGKTAALVRIGVAHASAGDAVACFAVDPSDGGAALTALLDGSEVAVEAVAATELAAAVGAATADLVLVDTPPAWPGADALGTLARALKATAIDETHLALRAGTAAGAAAELADGLAALAPNRLLLTAAAESAHVGGALDLALRQRLPLGYVAAGPDALAPADPRELASQVTP